MAKRGLISPDAELNADLTSLEDITSVSELGIECESGSELLARRSTSMTRPTPRLASVSQALIKALADKTNGVSVLVITMMKTRNINQHTSHN